jgi:hypothetical protein
VAAADRAGGAGRDTVLAPFDVFGQRTVLAGAGTPVVSPVVNSPAHVRGGLIVTTEILITPHQQLQNARLFLSSSWFEGIRLCIAFFRATGKDPRSAHTVSTHRQLLQRAAIVRPSRT